MSHLETALQKLEVIAEDDGIKEVNGRISHDLWRKGVLLKLTSSEAEAILAELEVPRSQ
jgi:hypothetical protein